MTDNYITYQFVYFLCILFFYDVYCYPIDRWYVATWYVTTWYVNTWYDYDYEIDLLGHIIKKHNGLSTDLSQYSYNLALFKRQFFHDFVIQSYNIYYWSGS